MSGWGSWLTGSAPADGVPPTNFRAASDLPQDGLFGALTPKDLEWTCAGGFTTETQTFYSVLETGDWIMAQVIHSAVGLWYPQIQFVVKHFNPTTGQRLWKSINVTNFVTPPPANGGVQLDKRSCRSDQFSITHNAAHPDGGESYSITANVDAELQLSLQIVRPASCKGWKLGGGEQGGMSYFGTNEASPDGYVVHRFWPRATSSGHLINKGVAVEAKGQAMFVHAIQGMRPNLVASQWNFANFQSDPKGSEGTSAIMMEFTTTYQYGDAKSNGESTRDVVSVNIGSVAVGDKLVAVTAATKRAGGEKKGLNGSQSRAELLDLHLDPDTGYQVPNEIRYVWDGPGVEGVSGQVGAELTVDLSGGKGLIEKVDVLAELPRVVKALVNTVAGTKPYIYQTLHPTTLRLTLPGASAGTKEVKGLLFEEHSYISQ